jgi:CAAX prenyl protease-like protein
MPQRASFPYIIPFAVFMAMLALRSQLHLGRWEYPVWTLLVSAVLWFCSRSVIDLRVSYPVGTILIGVAVFAIWIAPELIWPGYRQHWLFQNQITGRAVSSVPEALRGDWMALTFRVLRAAAVVPIVEELFWRGWLMRWIINPDIRKTPLGAYTRQSFWLCAILFASEHGAYWEVGLLAGIAYNWWMIRTKSLGDCILAHAITNACLSGYVLQSGNWQYW